jgi:molecular chaperone IbpA
MTHQKYAFGTQFNNYLGIESILKDMERMAATIPAQQDKYPPHNIIQQTDNKYIVELAVAGFTIHELSIMIEDSKLVISGDKPQKTDKEPAKYLHRGISTKSFSKTIPVIDTVVVNRAEYVDGILRVYLENVIPESKKPKRIVINDHVNPVLLTR